MSRRTSRSATAGEEDPASTCPADWGVGDSPNASQAKDWRPERRALREHDLCLSDLARRWAAGLPEAAKPIALLKAYPRIANRLALCWNDPNLSVIVIIKLLSDERGGRRGFPQLIRSELRKLYAHATQRRNIESALADGRIATSY